MRDKHSDLMRIGKVSSIDYEKCTAQVVFEDRHDLVSGDMHIVVPLTLKDRYYYMPDIDERVLVLFDPSAPTKGYILGSYYADPRPPIRKDEHKRYARFEDDTLIEYDREEHKLSIHIPKEWAAKENAVDVNVPEVDNLKDTSIVINVASDLNIIIKRNIKTHADIDIITHANENIHTTADKDITETAGENIYETAGLNITIKAGEDIHIEAGSNVTIKAGADMLLEADGDMTLKATNIHLNP